MLLGAKLNKPRCPQCQHLTAGAHGFVRPSPPLPHVIWCILARRTLPQALSALSESEPLSSSSSSSCALPSSSLLSSLPEGLSSASMPSTASSSSSSDSASDASPKRIWRGQREAISAQRPNHNGYMARKCIHRIRRHAAEARAVQGEGLLCCTATHEVTSVTQPMGVHGCSWAYHATWGR